MKQKRSRRASQLILTASEARALSDKSIRKNMVIARANNIAGLIRVHCERGDACSIDLGEELSDWDRDLTVLERKAVLARLEKGGYGVTESQISW